MNHPSVRRRTLLLTGLASASLLGACEDKRVKELNAGITRDSAVTVMSHDLKPGATSDSFPNVYTRERFLMGGKNVEVLYFTPENDKAPVAATGQEAAKIRDSIPYSRLTPIVFIDNRLAGRGWAYWDSMSTANKIPLKKH
jgi:hypothetical protein